MNKYSFRINSSEDPQIIEILSTLQGKERTNFIREALRFYVKNGEIINKMSDNIQKMQKEMEKLSADIAEIKEMIKTQPAVADFNKNTVLLEHDKNNKKKTNEEILKGLVNDFLNM
ncbi:hypothetical protein VTU32_06665 [Thermoanaerobacter sp. CM-CNRG TB177]|jgi:valyl-tRNA synthetase|uniref:hypothetical protein n=1 Tax=Thermoanaerobacter sp. CM-CNRG TB177 TaxID=2800659 RepID=UPI001BDE4172|nr:hypothetical protein [Thermoanaerobacter sp. CM-CNRG TB177]MBT1278979.1 hypothetical protein [Thermoanaerobacter sp. CM-CNRG TB177]